MAGSLHFKPEQIRNLPINMQVQIGLWIAAQLAQSVPVAEQEKQSTEDDDAEMRPESLCQMPVSCNMCERGSGGIYGE